MILLREIQTKDLNTLERFSQIPGFINLPDDKELLSEKIQTSIASFAGKFKDKADCKYWFVAENLKTKKVVGTSMIAGQHGTLKSPHFYFQVGVEKTFSKTINTGFIHGTLELKFDTDGPSEIGGLVVDPEYRNSPEKIGRQIAFVRFLFLGINKSKFKSNVIAELLPPLNKKGQSPLWEAIGRRFTNMDYWEADRLCQKDKEFIFSLFPTTKIYTTFFSAEARNAVGKVGKDTEAIYHMLSRIGFEYKNQVDPFDGGPHLWANVEEITTIKEIQKVIFKSERSSTETPVVEGLIAKSAQKAGEFRAVSFVGSIWEEELRFLNSEDEKEVVKCLDLRSGDSVYFMPYYANEVKKEKQDDSEL